MRHCRTPINEGDRDGGIEQYKKFLQLDPQLSWEKGPARESSRSREGEGVTRRLAGLAPYFRRPRPR